MDQLTADSQGVAPYVRVNLRFSDSVLLQTQIPLFAATVDPASLLVTLVIVSIGYAEIVMILYMLVAVFEKVVRVYRWFRAVWST